MKTLRTLIVDDEELARRGLEIRLEKFPDISIVGQSRNGREALAAITDTTPDLMFLDVQMPGMDGFEVLRRMKDEASLRDIPVIVVSGLEDTESVNRCLEMGAVDFISKPFDLVQIKTCVDRSLPDRGVIT